MDVAETCSKIQPKMGGVTKKKIAPLGTLSDITYRANEIHSMNEGVFILFDFVVFYLLH